MGLVNTIKILELRNTILAKVDYKGDFTGIGNAYRTLKNWSNPNGFNNPATNKTITIYHDDPNKVGINNVRQSACIIVDKEIKTTETIKQLNFKPGKCAVGRFEISFFEFKKAWEEMFDWINKNNLEKAERDAFEVYQTNANKSPKQKVIIDICIPVK